MNAPVSRRAHGLADYAYVLLTAFAPRLFGFEHDKQAANLCRTLSAATLLYTACTRAEWGMLKVIPYKTHLMMDTVAGAANLAMPWLLGFTRSARARNTVIVLGITGIAAGLLSGVFSDDVEE